MTLTTNDFREVKYECDRCEGVVTSIVRAVNVEPKLPNGWIEVRVLVHPSTLNGMEKYHFCVVCRNSLVEWRHQIRDEIVSAGAGSSGPMIAIEINPIEEDEKKEPI